MKRFTILTVLAVVLSTLAMISWADPDPGGSPGESFPVCLGCHKVGSLPDRYRNKGDVDCIRMDPDYPYILQVGRCEKYECIDDTWSYYFDGWYSTSGCTDEEVADPDECPAGNCFFNPLVSKTSAAGGWSGSRDEPLTSQQASGYVRNAMSGHEEN